MGGGIYKKILSELHLIYGDVLMPKGFEIDQKKLSSDILKSELTNSKFLFSRNWDMLNTYIRDHVNVEQHINLINKQTWGNSYKPNEISIPLLNIDPVDLRNSPDYTLIYALDCGKDSCELVIEYDDNRRKNRTWHLPVHNNHFYLFPSTQKYFITKNNSKQLNVLLTINYEYI